jgi:murein DD-endopeptidase MepM/ murein hydrolase activator NlpD/urea transporter
MMRGGSALKAVARRVAEHARPVLRAYALLVFGGGALPGLLLLLATFEEPRTALLGLLAVVVAHAVASLAGYDRDTVSSGYYGYNALLVGLAFATSGATGLTGIFLVSGGATLAVLSTAVLGDLLRRFALPVLALPFVLVASLVWHTTLRPGELPYWLAPEPQATSPLTTGAYVLEGLGAIVFCPTKLGGVSVILAVALYSRARAAALIAGAWIGAAVARELGAQGALALPAAYNGALTFAALAAAFYVLGPASICVAAVASALSGWLTAALLMPFAPLSIPVLAWPFVAVTLLVMRALGLRTPGRPPLLALLPGASPEGNLAHARTLAKRLGLPGPPRFVVPVRGVWRITQGVDGAITHRGPWRHALDFEILDRDGFPFRGDGAALEDYYCFGKPVLAPGTGVVVAVHDGAPDGPPGHQDLVHPWGNAIVVQHGPALFSVLAHLERGSIGVAVGQSVVAGEPLARCGASGRSPRPHLHFQAQASAVLGAPTLDFRLVRYAVQGADRRYERMGVPTLGMAIESPEPTALDFPAAEIELVVDGQRRVTLRREISPYGEHSLVNTDNQERLYFVPEPHGVVLTTLRGAADGLLGALLQIAPQLPATSAPRLAFEEELDPEPLLPLPLRVTYQLFALFNEPATAKVRGTIARSGDAVVVESECVVRFLGFVVRHRRGRLAIDRRGLARIELWAGRSSAGPVVSGSRPSSAGTLEERSGDSERFPPCAVYH